jgi:DNA-binding transcriptional ArsR family regulator
MQAKREYRERDETEVAVLDALVDRTEEGMTVFELRTDVDVDIDELETALADLKDAGLITVENGEGPMRIYPDDSVVPEFDAEDAGDETSFIEGLKKKLGL